MRNTNSLKAQRKAEEAQPLFSVARPDTNPVTSDETACSGN